LSLQALAPGVHKELGAFVALIVVNCLILGRQEAFASRNRLRPALADAAGMASGFALALIMLGATLFGVDLFGPSFEPWVIMILPPGGFITLGLLLGVFATVEKRRAQAKEAAELASAGREAA
jgi:electron transport complex protein RnfE